MSSSSWKIAASLPWGAPVSEHEHGGSQSWRPRMRLRKDAADMGAAQTMAGAWTSASSIRVPRIKLDQFVDLVGELVTVQARWARSRLGRRSGRGRCLGGG